jgi:hypothetical protein
MSQNDHEPGGHPDDEPESREATVGKEVVYGVLGLLVASIAVLIATGRVPIFPGG